MKKTTLILFFIMTISALSSQEKNIQIETKFGNIKLKLYDETPLHRDNFIKLVEEHFYDGLLFHRIIENFMIQGGDPQSRPTSDGTKAGSDKLEYTIPAEIIYPQYFHKKGALAAARIGDSANPEKASSASQFYIVTGKKYSDKDLIKMENSRLEQLKQSIYNNLQSENKSKIKEFYSNGDLDGLASFRQGLYAQAEEQARNSGILFTEEQKRVYKEIGGAPMLDKEYTVFGEIIEGFDVIDKIQKVKTNKNDRPEEDIKMKIYFY